MDQLENLLKKKVKEFIILHLQLKDLQNSLDEIKSKNVILIDEKGRKGAEGLNIAFLHPKSTFGVLN